MNQCQFRRTLILLLALWTREIVTGSEFIDYDVLERMGNKDLSKNPGHLKPFGTGVVHNVEEIQHVPDPESFYKDYVLPSKPVTLKGGVVNNPAFSKWTDDYFLNLDIPKPFYVDVEYHKKEIRGLNTKRIDFKSFVKTHNFTTFYMITSIPHFLRDDLILPFFLQCPYIIEQAIDEVVMWFSGGGTSSVVHSDDYHNINCVFRGSKEFIFIDTEKYQKYDPIDRPDGGFSTLDVDAVDFTKFPGLSKVEYMRAHLNAGDCVYIPTGWIHQVRSYDSNIATNIWWNYIKGGMNIKECNKTFDESVTIECIKHRNESKLNMFQNKIASILCEAKDKRVVNEELIDTLIPDIKAYEGEDFFKPEVDALKVLAQDIINILDTDKDGYVRFDEAISTSDDEWLGLESQVTEMLELFKRIDYKLKEGDEPRNGREEL